MTNFHVFTKMDFATTRMPHSLRLAGLITLTLLSGCASFRGANTTATPALLDAQKLQKSHAALALNRAEKAEYNGKTDDAIRLYEQARELDPRMGHLNRRLAVLYDQRGETERARRAFEEALRVHPKDADLLNDYGVHHLNHKDWAAAETWFERSLEIDGSHERATVNLGMALAMQDRLPESLEQFERAVGKASANSNLGVLLARQGRTAEARTYFQRALAIDATVRPAREFLSWLDSSSGEAIASQTEDSIIQHAGYSEAASSNQPR